MPQADNVHVVKMERDLGIINRRISSMKRRRDHMNDFISDIENKKNELSAKIQVEKNKGI